MLAIFSGLDVSPVLAGDALYDRAVKLGSVSFASTSFIPFDADIDDATPAKRGGEEEEDDHAEVGITQHRDVEEERKQRTLLVQRLDCYLDVFSNDMDVSRMCSRDLVSFSFLVLHRFRVVTVPFSLCVVHLFCVWVAWF